ncbi:MAG: hypothetical protein AAF571_03400 [Verrucomicrobiota bacterium]
MTQAEQIKFNRLEQQVAELGGIVTVLAQKLPLITAAEAEEAARVSRKRLEINRGIDRLWEQQRVPSREGACRVFGKEGSVAGPRNAKRTGGEPGQKGNANE